MTMKCSVFIATSLDGFIARESGDIDWLTSLEAPDPHEDYGYRDFIASVNALVMGRHTFETVLAFPDWPYTGTPLVVLSSTLQEVPAHLAESVELFSGAPAELVQRMAARGAHHLYIDGGQTIQGFLQAGLIDELIITHIPILLGSGIPLFGTLPADVHLEHLATQSYPTGLVQSKYRVKKRSQST